MLPELRAVPQRVQKTGSRSRYAAPARRRTAAWRAGWAPGRSSTRALRSPASSATSETSSGWRAQLAMLASHDGVYERAEAHRGGPGGRPARRQLCRLLADVLLTGAKVARLRGDYARAVRSARRRWALTS